MPYGYGSKNLVDLLNRLFNYKNGLPIEYTDKDLLLENFNKAKEILKLPTSKLIDSLRVKMLSAANNLNYELAADIKTSITSLDKLSEKQSVELKTQFPIDVMFFKEYNGFVVISILYYRNGILLNQRSEVIDMHINFMDASKEFINVFYNNNPKPQLLISNIDLDLNNLNTILPIKGDKKRVLQVANENCLNNIENKIEKFQRKRLVKENSLIELSRILSIDNMNNIVIVDNSHIYNRNPVSVFLTYINGNKNKSLSKKYSLKNKRS